MSIQKTIQKIAISLCDEAYTTVAAAVAAQTQNGSVSDGAYSLVTETGCEIEVGQFVADEMARKVEVVGGIAPRVYGGHGRVIVRYKGVLDVVPAKSLNLFWVVAEEQEEV